MPRQPSIMQQQPPSDPRRMVLNGPKINAIRNQKKNWSQVVFAEKAGVSANTIIRAERGDAIQRSNAHAIAGALGVDLKDLLPSEDNSIAEAERRLAGWDPFSDFIEQITRDFVGREYVLAAIEDFLVNQSKGYCIIEGDPGMGKSAILAEWILRNHSIAFFIRRPIGRNRTDQFLKSICLQLISRYDLPYKTLPANATQDGDFLSKLLTDARTKLDKEEKIIIAVDALDEVDLSGQSDHSNILYLPSWLPEGIYFVMTKRRKYHLPFTSQVPQKIIDLLKYPEESRRDIKTYIQNALKHPQLRAWVDRAGVGDMEFVETLADKSENNFMYLYYVLPEIEHGTYHNLNIEKLPVGLEGYYMDHWRVMGMMDRPLKRSKIKIVYVLAEVVKPVSRQLIADLTNEDGLTVQETLDEWLQFLHEELIDNTKRYSVYHTSFRDFLHRQDILQAAEVTIPDIHGIIADSLWDIVYGDVSSENGDDSSEN